MSSYGGRGPSVNIALWTQTALALMLVLMRVYTRVRILNSFGWDDGFLIATWFLLAVYAIFITIGTTYGIGQLRANIPPEDYIQAQKFEIIGQAVCIFNIGVSKAAVAFFILRILTEKWHKAIIWFLVVSNAIIATFGTVAVLVQCTPIQKTWDFAVPGSCTLDFATIGLVISGYAVAMDFILALSPCFVIWGLKMKRKEKILIMSGLSLGIFAGLCGILRTVALQSLKSLDEYIYDTADMLIYSGTENFVTAMCASIPVLRPLWSRLRYGEYGRGSSAGDSHGYQLKNRSGPSAGSRDAESGLGGKRGLETKIYSGNRKYGIETVQDNGSEETILRDMKNEHAVEESKQGVVCRTDISVNYSSGSERAVEQGR